MVMSAMSMPSILAYLPDLRLFELKRWCFLPSPMTASGATAAIPNADTIAQELARGLSSTFEISLVYSFEKSGVLLDAENDASVIGRIGPAYYQELEGSKNLFLRAHDSQAGQCLYGACEAAWQKSLLAGRKSCLSCSPARQEQPLYMSKEKNHLH